MKKLISLLSVAMLATSVFAIPATAKKMSPELTPKVQAQVATHPGNDFQLEQIQVPFAPKQVIAPKAEPAIKKAAKAVEADAVKAQYYKPIGSFFCGIADLYYADYGITLPGTSYFKSTPTVIGSWLNGYEYWTWPNISKNANAIQYVAGFDQKIGKKFGWDMDAKGNYLDTLAAFYAGDAHSWFSYRMPVQYATDGTNIDTFLLVGPQSARPDTFLGEAFTAGGLFNDATKDGMWPLTNAMFTTPEYGNGMGLVWDRDEKEHTASFIFGTEPIAIATGKDTLYEDDNVTIKQIIPVYDTIQPSIVQVSYQKPMSPLYIKDVTVALCNLEYAVSEDKWYYTDIKIDSLLMYILEKNPTSGKYERVAASLATKDDTVSMYSYNGQELTFKIQKKDDYGTIIEGVTVTESFAVAIIGLDREGNEFGIWSGFNPYLGSMQTAVLDTALEAYQYAPYDPFVMLNGMYYTLEHAARTPGFMSADPAYIDTININLEYDAEYEEYTAVHADGPFVEGDIHYIPMLRAVEMLFDTTSHKYNYVIDAKPWYQFDMDYDGYPYSGDPQEGVNWWTEFNAYNLYIWGDATDTSLEGPEVGDVIKFSRYGSQIVFKVVQVDEKPEGINNVIRTVNDNKLYNVLGIEVDKDYKGVVIRNGEKFLQR